ENFPLTDDERATVVDLPALPAKLKKRLGKKDSGFTVTETASIVLAIADTFLDAEPKQQMALLLVSKKLMDCLQANIVMPDSLPAKTTRKSKTPPTDTVYQFKITLLGVKPPIWRRIQVKDCTLDKLHEHIQTSMGW